MFQEFQKFIPGCLGSPGGTDCKESDWNARDPGLIPGSVFLPGEFHEQRSLVGYSPWGQEESDMTEWLTKQKVVWFLDIYLFTLTSCEPLNFWGINCNVSIFNLFIIMLTWVPFLFVSLHKSLSVLFTFTKNQLFG